MIIGLNFEYNTSNDGSGAIDVSLYNLDNGKYYTSLIWSNCKLSKMQIKRLSYVDENKIKNAPNYKIVCEQISRFLKKQIKNDKNLILVSNYKDFRTLYDLFENAGLKLPNFIEQDSLKFAENFKESIVGENLDIPSIFIKLYPNENIIFKNSLSIAYASAKIYNYLSNLFEDSGKDVIKHNTNDEINPPCFIVNTYLSENNELQDIYIYPVQKIIPNSSHLYILHNIYTNINFKPKKIPNIHLVSTYITPKIYITYCFYTI